MSRGLGIISLWKANKRLVLTALLVVTTASVLLYTKYVTVDPNKLCSGPAANCVSSVGANDDDDRVKVKGTVIGLKPTPTRLLKINNTSKLQFVQHQVAGSNKVLKYRADPGPGKTFVTYDDSVVIQCADSSPYVVCPGKTSANRSVSETDVAPKGVRRQRPWKVAIGRELIWAPKCAFSQCPYNNCIVQEKFAYAGADVVYFNGAELNENMLPPPRQGNQTWVFMVWESPWNTRSSFLHYENSIWNKQFNLAVTYRTDSDVFVPYAFLYFQPTALHERPSYYEIAKKKPKTVIWIVSNCDSSKRMEYVEQLKKYIDVDVYGGCGIPCSKKLTDNCNRDLMMQYRFYLSFENSLCTDYITEKLFKLYEPDTHIIPIVRGGASYAKYIPENTFISTTDFSSPRILAEHLKSLGSDHSRYAQMLEHKDLYRSQKNLEMMWCLLCEHLTTKGVQKKNINMKKWWSDDNCFQPKDLE